MWELAGAMKQTAGAVTPTIRNRTPHVTGGGKVSDD